MNVGLLTIRGAQPHYRHSTQTECDLSAVSTGGLTDGTPRCGEDFRTNSCREFKKHRHRHRHRHDTRTELLLRHLLTDLNDAVDEGRL